MNLSFGRSFIPAAGSLASPPRKNISIVDLTKCGMSSNGHSVHSVHNMGSTKNDKERIRSAVSRRTVILVNGSTTQNVSSPVGVKLGTSQTDVNLQDQVLRRAITLVISM